MRDLIDKALNRGYVLLPLAHLTTAGTGWSASGPPPGKKRWPSPGGGRGNNRMPYEKPTVLRLIVFDCGDQALREFVGA